MKKFIIYILIFSAFSIYAQDQVRENVLIEVATGFDFPYCPGTALGADDLINNGYPAAIFQHHYNDSLENSYSLARINYYGVSEFPNTRFDGINSFNGGNTSESLFYPYLVMVNERKNIPTYILIDQSLTDLGGGNFNVEVVVKNFATNLSDHLTLYLGITESGLPSSWIGIEEVNFITRKMIPDASGTALDFSGSVTLTNNFDFTLDESWNIDQCELIAFVQIDEEDEIGEVLQSVKQKFTPIGINYDIAILQVLEPTHTSCEGNTAPLIQIKNNGWQTISSLEIEFQLNDEITQNFSWEGELPYGYNTVIELPVSSFELLDENLLSITCSQPNGNADEVPENNTIEQTFNKPAVLPNAYLVLELQTDNYPQEISWEILNNEGDQIYFVDTMTMVNSNYIFNLPFEETGCYSFDIFDSYGDGICCNNGDGYYYLKNSFFDSVYLNDMYHVSDQIEFTVGETDNYFAYFESEKKFLYVNDSIEFTNFSYGTDEQTTYQWIFEGGTPDTSTAKQPPVIRYNELGLFDVTLIITNNNDSDTLHQEDYISVTHADMVVENYLLNLSVNPNPFYTFAKLKFFVIERKNISVKLIDNNGSFVQEVFNGVLETGNHTIDINRGNLEKGVYYLFLTFEGKQIARKIVIM